MAYKSTAKRRAYMRAWYAKNKVKQVAKATARNKANREKIRRTYREKYALRYREDRLRKLYGLTKRQFDKYEKILCCQICRKETKLNYDHDHITGKVRGKLCNACNLGLGKLGDSLEALKKAVIYLENK